MKTIKLHLCGCGCKTKTKWCSQRKKYNKYLHGHHRRDKTHTKETKQKNREAHLGKVPWNKGLKRLFSSKEWGSNISKAKLGKKLKPFTEEHLKNMKIAKKGKNKRENNPNWKGGKSFEPYGLEFNNKLKKQIRTRDKNRCQICNKRKYKREHPVHHIDYNKQNNDPNNLITLCKNCHSETNGNRKYWTEFFNNKIKEINNNFLKEI